MPLYEYQCENCGERFEVIEKFSAAPLTTHAKCGGPVHRLVSAPALQFKGSGWYITDYAKGKSGGESDNGGAAKPDSATTKTGSEGSGGTSADSSAGSSTKSGSDTKTKAGSESKTGSDTKTTKPGTDSK